MFAVALGQGAEDSPAVSLEIAMIGQTNLSYERVASGMAAWNGVDHYLFYFRRFVDGDLPLKHPALPSIEEFVTGQQYLKLRPTPYQLTLQKAMYGLALTDQELDIWRECTGGREYSGKPFSEPMVWTLRS